MEQTTAMQFDDPSTKSRTVQSLFEAIVTTRQRRTEREHSPRQDQPQPSNSPTVRGPAEDQPEGGLYIISVAARILQMHPQTLRKYERVGLVRPSRTDGMLRLYSEQDIAKLRMIKHLVDELRLNLAGVELALSVFNRLSAARSDVAQTAPARARAFERAAQEILQLFRGR